MKNGKYLMMVVIFIISAIACKQVKEECVVRYSAPGNIRYYGNAMVVDDSGNVYVTGESDNRDSNRDYVTVKYSPQGKEKWVARYNGPENNSDIAIAIAVDAGGNVYVTGSSMNRDSNCDYVTVKYSPQGKEEWIARYNGTGNGQDEASAIAVDALGNVYVTGSSRNLNSVFDYVTVKYSLQGKEEWIARYKGTGNNWDEAIAIAVDALGNVYVTGSSRNLNSGFDYVIVKYSLQGKEEWTARYSCPGNDWDQVEAIAVDDSGNVYVTGSIRNQDSNSDYVTVKYSPRGQEQWTARYKGTGNSWDVARAIAVDAGGNAYVTGSSMNQNSNHDYATVKYSPQGQEQWAIHYNGSGNDIDIAGAIALDAKGNVYVAGLSMNRDSTYDYCTIKYSQGRR
jgi:uncharacterized delta-60 repeat protein